MARFFAVLRLVFSRSMGNRRLLATVVVGVVLSAALMSSVAIYSDAIRDLGLKHALESEDPQTLDIEVLSSSHGFTSDLYADRVEITESELRHAAGSVLDAIVRYGKTDTFFLTPEGGAVNQDDDRRPRSNFQFYENLNDHIHVVDGRLAETAPAGSGPPHVEVMIGEGGAEQLGVAVGDTFDLHPFWAPEMDPVSVTVVGIVAPDDPAEAFWFGAGEEGRFVVTTTSWPTYVFFVPEEAITGALTGYLPGPAREFLDLRAGGHRQD